LKISINEQCGNIDNDKIKKLTNENIVQIKYSFFLRTYNFLCFFANVFVLLKQKNKKQSQVKITLQQKNKNYKQKKKQYKILFIYFLIVSK
jgi:hypothetical protein